MPRPHKCRKVCCMPQVRVFRPMTADAAAMPVPAADPVVLTVDEYETVRLLDKEGFSQAETAHYMQVARTTVQAMYDRARKKMAAALVDGRVLFIEGGQYRLCDGSEEHCGCGGCKKHRRCGK